ncbi:DNA gyrase subunit A [Phaeodactylibacter xiamenensis]|jgi:DNA gyrase subunit A|uniref:DNA gyrase subunit A n=1 Tax=Phaeodactylibacter xiamenensis TaxID=1524460 RepID=UPI0024A8F558|nr:DNA gyrase subunit A [Phaeodactylibacter xiamenensis]
MSLKQRIIPVNIEDQMKSAYIDYSMSVIVSRALPDVRDGLKPVHRRVLYGMSDLGLTYNKSYKKSARIVGEVLGKYHPHGDSSVYDTMVRMAQNWSLRYPLVDGQGNFGSMDGDSPAAMRYTEARLERISDEMLADIGKETVDFAFNFDDTLKEPTVLPARIPNLLVNGASGIAVGMATNMLPHNLTEVVNGIVAQIANPDITIEELMQYIKAPDFPTGGIIYGTSGVREAFETGRGRVVVRGRAEIQVADNGRETIVVTEIPYQVNKANLVAKIAELVNDKKIIGISDIRDESDRDGLRIVVDVKRDAMASVVLSMLYKYTALQTSYGVNNVALVNGRPELLNLKDIISEFIKFRIEVIVRRTQYDLRKAIARAHILVGLLIALDYIDMVIDLIRGSATPEDARNGLMEGAFIEDRDKFWKQFGPLIEQADTDEYPREEGNALSEAQARAILDMRLQKLTGLERDKVKEEYDELQERIAYLKSILESEELQREIAAEELQEIKEKYGDERRTDITAADGEISIEDLIANEEVVVTISSLGYIKRTPVSEYRKQSRGGRGSRGSKTRDADFVEHLFIASTHNYLLLFTESGRCHWLRVYEIPEANKTSSGRVIQNILAIPKDDSIKAYINIQDLTDEEFINNNNIVFCTRNGLIKKTLVEAYSRPRAGGINAITINEGDQLIEAKLTNGNQEVFIASRSGRAIRFEESKVRAMGRTAAGVRGISLNEDGKDIAVGMVIIDPEEAETAIMVLSEKGMGKRTLYSDYRLTNRGGKGVKNMQITDKTGGVFSIKAVSEDSDLMITTRDGIVIRMAVSDIRVMGRATQGVRLIKLDKHDEMADIAVIHKSEDEDEPTTPPAFDEEE